jgi:hypothetical protein
MQKLGGGDRTSYSSHSKPCTVGDANYVKRNISLSLAKFTHRLGQNAKKIVTTVIIINPIKGGRLEWPRHSIVTKLSTSLRSMLYILARLLTMFTLSTVYVNRVHIELAKLRFSRPPGGTKLIVQFGNRASSSFSIVSLAIIAFSN